MSAPKYTEHWLVVACLVIVGSASAASLFAKAPGDAAIHLQQEIDRASEAGNYAQMQVLRLDLARHYETVGSYGLAARQYELLLASRPSWHERVAYFVQLGKMRGALEDYGGAIQAYEDALHDDPNSWEASMSLAHVYARIDLNAKALEIYKRCIEKRPKAAEAYQGIAEVYQRLGLLSSAIASYSKALELDPDPDSYLGMADCYVRLGDTQHAAEVLQKAKTILPRVAYDVRLGEIYQSKGNIRRACAAWEEALKAAPHRADVQLNLVLAYENLGRQEDAERLLRRLQSEYPDSPLVHFIKAWVFYERGDSRSAKQEALAVQTLDPTEVVRHYNDLLLALIQKRPKAL